MSTPQTPKTPKTPKAPKTPKTPQIKEGSLTELTAALKATKVAIKVVAGSSSTATGSGKSNLNRFPSLKRLPKAECTIKRLVGAKFKETLPVGAKVPVCAIPAPGDVTSTFVVYAVTNSTYRVPQSIFRLIAPKSIIDGQKVYACPTDANSLASWAKEVEGYGLKLVVKAFPNAEAAAELSKLKA